MRNDGFRSVDIVVTGGLKSELVRMLPPKLGFMSVDRMSRSRPWQSQSIRLGPPVVFETFLARGKSGAAIATIAEPID